ncbi:polysaccharide biosynthesis protein CapD [Thalassobaculum fulvum]|uniref:Polysaccharide biosynthesis protein CapD n=1 Tax=Thalassobaculum fulvum TaxID=1633335 RepID=A0A918XTJ2_9PROT|nr:nucleoside-diphosphate sugar epimerase/dehydratase [Thalassobaculum fulvum]GHD55035.1 polysaccharide biosynthesis protein CapD [Thalassobaculum fulvum]
MTGRALRRSAAILVHDVAMAAVSFLLSLYLRLGEGIWWWPRQVVETGLAAFTLTALAVLLVVRLDTAVWRYTSIGDLVRIVRAVVFILAGFLVVQFALTRLDDFPRSFLVIEAFVLTVLLAAPRFAYRLLKDGTLSALLERDAQSRIPVLLVGAGDGADLFIREMARGGEATYRVVGIVDDRDARTGRQIRGVRVMGGLDDLAAVVERLTGGGLRPQRLVLTRSRMDGATVRRLFEQGDALGIPVSRMPRVGALEAADGGTVTLRPINVEDVLGRPQATLDRDAMRALIAGRRVLVTGAGGTIGSELVRQVAGFGPAALTLVDSSEYALYLIDREMGEGFPELERRAMIGDVRDRARVAEIMRLAAPEIVFHAAALKHVPLMEANVDDAVLTNAIGSRIVADAARAAGVRAVVLISTDKAVNPTNVMGATKRLAEAYAQALDLADGTATRFVTTRFGNVLGSTGSVVPLFQRQLERGGPLTVTHPEMTRYFMTVREAVELVLQAAALEVATEGGRGGITVLDMGEPVKIVDLARQMIRLAGLVPDEDVRIEFTGLRPGEKLYEELFHDAEALEPTPVPALRRARPRTTDIALLGRGLDELEAAARDRDTAATLRILSQLVPEYAPPADAPEVRATGD